ncbi:hypothetical protein HS088_TW10G00482 [Tripterygium wilfordii]|uniref:Uncharacterized protein n=2 Tax=Tripterygium wilfordii TaxID=458696 RepID=A0A7J7D566_TRIWF|nr:hypothetical protein HS088_TW10G00482 [Tripterygium wilfordii]
MRAKMYFLRNQKMELDSRLLEMQSTIVSLKDEQKAMESALEEKQNEIKILREARGTFGEENPEVIALTDSLKQKEDEIQDLRHHLEHPAKVWSVSTDDPSNPTPNLTASNDASQTSVIDESKQQGRFPDEVTSTKNWGNSTRGEDGSEHMLSNSRISENRSQDEYRNDNGTMIIENMGIKREEELQNSHQQDFTDTDAEAAGRSIEEEKNGHLKDGVETGTQEMNTANSGETKIHIGGKEVNTKDAETEMISKDDEQHEAARDEQPGKQENVSAGQNWNSQSTAKGGMKLEQATESGSAGTKVRGKHGHLSKRKGKRWTMLVKSRPLESNGRSEESEFENVRKQNSLKYAEDRWNIREGGATTNVEKAERVEGKTKSTRAGKALDSSNPTLLKHQLPENTGNLVHKVANGDTNDEVGGLLKRPRIFQDNQRIAKMTESTEGESHNVNSDGKKPNLDEATQKEAHDGGTQESTGSRDLNAEQEKAATKLKVPKNMEVADTQGDSESDNNEIFGNSTSSLEEDNEEYKEETDESEF